MKENKNINGIRVENEINLNEKEINENNNNINNQNDKIKKFNILNSNISNTFNFHSDYINQIILLKDGRIASSSNDKSIIIYNKINYSIQLQIKNLDDCVYNIIQGSNDNIYASIGNGTISIFKLTSLTTYEKIQTFKIHNDRVRKIIELKDGRFASCSKDKTIQIWEFNNNELIIYHIFNQDNSISCILESNENEIISTPEGNGSINFWNINESLIISKISKIECNWSWNNLKKSLNDIIIVGGIKYIYLINNYDLINKIEIKNDCYSLCCLNNGNILTGHGNGYIKQWNLDNNELKFIEEKKVNDNYAIRVISQLKNDLISSGSNTSIINLYKIN